MKLVSMFAVAILFCPILALAQTGGSQDSMPGMKMGDESSAQQVTFIDAIEQRDSSGASSQPISTPIPMLMKTHGAWSFMFHANAFVVEEQQSSSRGGDKVFSTNWFMPMASRKLPRGVFSIRAMLSLEPATVTAEQYPLLFQLGETAFGKAIADGQHPHNLFMELAVLYDVKLGTRTLLSLYAAPVGDPAIGPAAYPHRASASENPLAALGHHQEDSTHIADDVVTLGLTYRRFGDVQPLTEEWKLGEHGGLGTHTIAARRNNLQQLFVGVYSAIPSAELSVDADRECRPVQ